MLALASLPAAGQRTSEFWERAIEAFEAEDREQPPQPGGTMFLGSSSIVFWDLERWFPKSRFPDLRAVNRGFGGSTIADSLYFFDRIVPPHRPARIVFYAGDNDISAGKSAQTVAADFAELAGRVWAEWPETRLIYVAIKPSLARWHLAPEMRAANALVAAAAEDEPRLSFLDIDTPMIGADGRPRPELFVSDGLHLSDHGYRLWTDLLAPHLGGREGAGPTGELIFPLEHWHNHGSSIVELPNGDLLTAWFHGSGERRSDDVRILGARLRAGARTWSEPFLLADTPGFPDTNCTMLLEPTSAGGHRLWLFWPTIQANLWESALMKVKVSTDFEGPGPPVWQWQDVLHMKPGEGFHDLVAERTDEYFRSLGFADARDPTLPERTRNWAARNLEQAADKLTRRLGWFTRAHPVVLALPEGGQRLLLGLYSDGFSFASATYSDDGGHSWTMSEPIIGGGNIQPTFALRDDGTLLAFMRDNGPPPERAHVAESSDLGATWTIARDHPDLVESGAGLEVLKLASGRWIVVHNDIPDGRYRLAVSVSEDEGRTFRRTRYIEREEKDVGRYHYPSVIQARDGRIHVTYSYHVAGALDDGGQGKSIKHVSFDETWLLGDD
jgi:predicted neuraminidase/lysophospholipase L1-like esterase